jgi:hypothetical protein
MIIVKIDFKKELREFYRPSRKKVTIVDVPDMGFLMLNGKGDPNKAQEYKNAIETLYSTTYTLKFIIKKEQRIDYTVMPLEGLWWTEDMDKFSIDHKEIWKWTSMIMQPEFVTEILMKRAIEEVRKKKNPSALSKMRYERFNEGLSAQIMHIGPFSEEGPTIQRLHDFIKKNGYEIRSKHHEIYLSDPRRSKPENMKIVIRQPISR